MPTTIDMFKKVYVELDVSSSPQQYNFTNDTFYTNSCFLNFSLITNSQSQVVDISVIQKTSVNGTIENTQTFTLNYNNNLVKRNINLFTPYTLIDISYNSIANSILSGFIEKMTLGDTIVVDTSGQTIAVRGGVDISGQRVDISEQRVDISGQSIYILSVDVSSNTITQVKSTPDYNANIGLNTYRIMPKMKTFTISGMGGNSTANVLWTNNYNNVGSTLSVTEYNWGRDVSGGIGKPMYVYAVNTLRTINYTYVDAEGIEANGSYTPAALSTWYQITPSNIVGINKIWTSTNPINGDNYYISPNNITTTNTGLGKSIAHISGITDTYCGIYTCPNNARAFISSMSVVTTTASEYLRIVHWTASGIRTIRNTIWCSISLNNVFTGGSELGSLSGWIEAGESISVFGTGTTNTGKIAYMIVNVYYY